MDTFYVRGKPPLCWLWRCSLCLAHSCQVGQFKRTSTRGHCGPWKIRGFWPCCCRWGCEQNGMMWERLKDSAPLSQCATWLSLLMPTSARWTGPVRLFPGWQRQPRSTHTGAKHSATGLLCLPAASVAGWGLQRPLRTPTPSPNASAVSRPCLQSRSFQISLCWYHRGGKLNFSSLYWLTDPLHCDEEKLFTLSLETSTSRWERAGFLEECF